MERYNIEVLRLSEVRWNTFGRLILNTGQTLLYSGKKNEDDPHEAGVGFILSKKACKSLIEWEPVSDRIITARLDSRFQKTTIIQCYAPTNDAPEEEKIAFYDALQATIDKVPGSDVSIVLGDMNAKVGEDNSGREENMGKHGVGSMNENGELFADFCGRGSHQMVEPKIKLTISLFHVDGGHQCRMYESKEGRMQHATTTGLSQK